MSFEVDFSFYSGTVDWNSFFNCGLMEVAVITLTWYDLINHIGVKLWNLDGTILFEFYGSCNSMSKRRIGSNHGIYFLLLT